VYVPQALCECVRTGYSNVVTLPASKNLVNKVPLVISGHKGEVYLDKLGNDGIPDNAGWRLVNEREQLLALHCFSGCWIAPQNQWTQGGSCGGKDPTTMGIPDAAVEFVLRLNAAYHLTT
jgi:hypothetical protein